MIEMYDKKETYHLVSTRCEFEYSEYLDWCEWNNVEPAEENSNGYYEWCAEEAQNNYDCDMDNLMYSELKDRTFAIEGTLGLWWGRPTIEPVVVNGIVPAIKRCFGRDINDIDAELNIKDGVIYVQAHHHDGTNCFTLKMLNKNGEKWIEAAIEKWRMNHEKGEDFELNNRYWTKLKSINDVWK